MWVEGRRPPFSGVQVLDVRLGIRHLLPMKKIQATHLASCGQSFSGSRFLSGALAWLIMMSLSLDSSTGWAAAAPRPPAGAASATSQVAAVSKALPEHVDNSTLSCFPPITGQGPTGACSIFAALYYQMTHMAGLVNRYNNKTSKATVFAPNWTMNFGVGGTGCYNLARKNGCASWEDIPFTPDPNVWNTDPAVWARALKHKVDKNGSIGNVCTPEGFRKMKELLSNGYVLYFDSWIGSFLFKRAGDDPSTDKDNAFIGKNVVWGLDNYVAGHAFAVVGYNDNIWVDINGNAKVEPSEKGAIKIVNSWSAAYEDKGFTYIAYDALREISTVEGVPTKRRFGAAFVHNTAYWVTFMPDYYPRLLARVTLNTSKRNQLKVQLGYSPSTQETPQYTWDSFLLNKQGGAMGFDGTEKAGDGSFVLDFTDLITEHKLEGAVRGRWYVTITDANADGNPVLLKDFTLIDNITKKSAKSSRAFPVSLDGTNAHVWVDYSLKLPVDKKPPTAPRHFSTGTAFVNRVTLTWAESKDNVAVKYYRIYRNGEVLLTTENTRISENNLPLGTSYDYAVAAVDTSNNMSPLSKTVKVSVPKSVSFDTNAIYKLVNKKSGKVLAASQGTYQPGVPFVQYNYSKQGSQHFKMVDAEDGSYRIYTLPGNMLVQVGDAAMNSGARVSQWSDNGSDGCKWIMLFQRPGEYMIVNKNSGQVLSVVGASTEHGATMEQTVFVNDDSQLWQIEALPK